MSPGELYFTGTHISTETQAFLYDFVIFLLILR